MTIELPIRYTKEYMEQSLLWTKYQHPYEPRILASEILHLRADLEKAESEVAHLKKELGEAKEFLRAWVEYGDRLRKELAILRHFVEQEEWRSRIDKVLFLPPPLPGEAVRGPKVCDKCRDSMSQCGMPNKVPACCWDDSSTTKPCPNCCPVEARENKNA